MKADPACSDLHLLHLQVVYEIAAHTLLHLHVHKSHLYKMLHSHLHFQESGGSGGCK